MLLILGWRGGQTATDDASQEGSLYTFPKPSEIFLTSSSRGLKMNSYFFFYVRAATLAATEGV